MKPHHRLQDIQAFLQHRRLALVGASRDPKHFSRAVMEALLARGYDIVPIHPVAAEIGGRRAYPRLTLVDPPVEGAVIMTPAAAAQAAVEDCLDAGVPRIWLHRGAGVGSVSPGAVAACARDGVPVIAGECPLMFLGHEALVHRVHAWAKRVAGSYPSHA